MSDLQSTVLRFSAIIRLALLLALTTLAATACGDSDSEKGSRWGKGRGDAERPDPLVEVERARRGSIPTLERSTGRVEARNVADVYAQVSEVVVEIRHDVGDYVEQGALLARLKADELLLRLRSAELALQEAELVHSKNQLDSAKRKSDLERVERHFGPNNPEGSRIFTREDYDAAKLEYDKAINTVQSSALALSQARGEVAATAMQLSHSDIRAPISGYIIERNVRTNELVSNNALLFRMADFSMIEVRLDVAEARLASMHEPKRLPGVSVLGLDEKVELQDAQAVLLSMTAFPQQRFLGYLDRVHPVVDEARGMIVVVVRVIQPRDVHAERHANLLRQFDPPSQEAVLRTAESARGGARLELRPGMWVDARIATEFIEDALLVPGAAIVGDTENIWAVTPDEDDPTAGIVRAVDIAGRRGVSSQGAVQLLPRPAREGTVDAAGAAPRGTSRQGQRTGAATSGADIAEGTLVVVRGQGSLRDGQRVRIRYISR